MISQSRASRATAASSDAEGIPGIPSIALTRPSCMWPPADSAMSSECEMIGLLVIREYSSARRITRELSTGTPSSENPTAPASSRIFISVNSVPFCPFVMAAIG